MFLLGHRPSLFPAGQIEYDDTRHAAIFGASGSGKSTLLTRLTIEHIRSGRPGFFLDPHGTYVEAALPYVPKSRLRDVIVYDPLSSKPIGLNPLKAKDEVSAGHFIKILGDQFGENSFMGRSHMIARNFLFAAVEALPDPTPFDLWLMFMFESYARWVFEHSNSPTLDRWAEDYFGKTAKQREEASAAPMNKADALVAMQSLRHIFAQPDGLDFFECMQTKKLVFFNLRKGQIGEEAANLLGSVILRMVLTAALQRDPLEKNDLCAVIVDEFHNFTKGGNGPEQFLAETRKYGIAFTLASQSIAQLPKGAEDSIFANVSTLISMQVSGKDAALLAPELRVENAASLVDLKTGDMYAKVKRPDLVLTNQYITVPKWFRSGDRKHKFPQYLPLKKGDEASANTCHKYSEEHYGRKREAVETIISTRLEAAYAAERRAA
jgi:hypothetical protein